MKRVAWAAVILLIFACAIVGSLLDEIERLKAEIERLIKAEIERKTAENKLAELWISYKEISDKEASGR